MDYEVYRKGVYEAGLRKLWEGDPTALEPDEDNDTWTEGLVGAALQKLPQHFPTAPPATNHTAAPHREQHPSEFDEGRFAVGSHPPPPFGVVLTTLPRYWLEHWRGGIPGVINTDCHVRRGKVRVSGTRAEGSATPQTTCGPPPPLPSLPPPSPARDPRVGVAELEGLWGLSPFALYRILSEKRRAPQPPPASPPPRHSRTPHVPRHPIFNVT